MEEGMMAWGRWMRSQYDEEMAWEICSSGAEAVDKADWETFWMEVGVPMSITISAQEAFAYLNTADDGAVTQMEFNVGYEGKDPRLTTTTTQAFGAWLKVSTSSTQSQAPTTSTLDPFAVPFPTSTSTTRTPPPPPAASTTTAFSLLMNMPNSLLRELPDGLRTTTQTTSTTATRTTSATATVTSTTTATTTTTTATQTATTTSTAAATTTAAATSTTRTTTMRATTSTGRTGSRATTRSPGVTTSTGGATTSTEERRPRKVTSAMLTLRKHSTSSSPHSAANPVSASSTTHRATREAAPTASPKHMTTVATAPAPSRTTSTAPQNRSTSTTTGTPDPFSVQPSAAEAAPASSTTQRATRETTPTLAPKQLTTAAAAPVERPTTTTSTTQPASQSATKRSVAGVAVAPADAPTAARDATPAASTAPSETPTKVAFTLQNLEFNQISASPTVLSALRLALKKMIASKVGHGVAPSDVLLSLSPGSVAVEASVPSTPAGVSASDLQSLLQGSVCDADSAQSLASSVGQVEGIGAFMTGGGVSVDSKQAGCQVAPDAGSSVPVVLLTLTALTCLTGCLAAVLCKGKAKAKKKGYRSIPAAEMLLVNEAAVAPESGGDAEAPASEPQKMHQFESEPLLGQERGQFPSLLPKQRQAADDGNKDWHYRLRPVFRPAGQAPLMPQGFASKALSLRLQGSQAFGLEGGRGDALAPPPPPLAPLAPLAPLGPGPGGSLVPPGPPLPALSPGSLLVPPGQTISTVLQAAQGSPLVPSPPPALQAQGSSLLPPAPWPVLQSQQPQHHGPLMPLWTSLGAAPLPTSPSGFMPGYGAVAVEGAALLPLGLPGAQT